MHMRPCCRSARTEAREVGAVVPQPREEDVAHLTSQVERHGGGADSSVARREGHDLLDLLRRVVDTRDQRCDEYARRHAASVQLSDGLQARTRLGVCGSVSAPSLLVESRHREVDRHLGALVYLLQQLDVAQHQRRLGDEGAGRARVAYRLPDAGHQLGGSRPTGRGRCWCPASRAPFPRGPRQLAAQQLRRVDLDDDLPLEVPARVEVEVLVGGRAKQLWLTTPFAMKSPVPVVMS